MPKSDDVICERSLIASAGDYISSATLSKRYCKLCTRYFPTQAALKRHMKANVCSVMRPARLDEEYIVRSVPEAEPDRPDNDEHVAVVPKWNIFDVLNPDLFSNQFEEVVYCLIY